MQRKLFASTRPGAAKWILLFTDVILPGETGRALAARLRQGNPGLKVLLVTGYSDQIGMLEAMQEECLGKPFSADVLLRRVRELLNRAEPVMGTESPVTHARGNA